MISATAGPMRFGTSSEKESCTDYSMNISYPILPNKSRTTSLEKEKEKLSMPAAKNYVFNSTKDPVSRKESPLRYCHWS